MATEASLNFKGYDVIKVVFDKPLGFSEGNFNINVNHLTHVDEENKNILLSKNAEVINDRVSLSLNNSIIQQSNFELVI